MRRPAPFRLSAAAPATVTGEVARRATGESREGRATDRADALTSASRETCQRDGSNRTGCSGDGRCESTATCPRPVRQGTDALTPSTPRPVELLVCVRCRRGDLQPETDPRPGARLFAALGAEPLPEGLRLTPVECLQNCTRGCTVALRGPGRWTYVYGGLDEAAHVGLLLEGAARYRDTADGLVPWRERPEHFRKNCIARLPPMEP